MTIISILKRKKWESAINKFIDPSEGKDFEAKKINNYKRWRKAPHALIAAIMRFVFGFLILAAYYIPPLIVLALTIDNMWAAILIIGGILLSVLFALLWLVASVLLIVFSGKYVFPSWWIAVPCPILFPRLYLIGLIIFAIVCKINKNKWEQEIQEYECKNGK